MTDKFNDPLDDLGVDSDKREASGDEYESMTAAEVVEKLEEVRPLVCIWTSIARTLNTQQGTIARWMSMH